MDNYFYHQIKIYNSFIIYYTFVSPNYESCFSNVLYYDLLKYFRYIPYTNILSILSYAIYSIN